MIVSVITPIYLGNKYLKDYFSMMNLACNEFISSENHVEVILVNDSPWIKIEFPFSSYNFDLKIIDNTQNVGIHSSRLHGLEHAVGEYILFLDQDDMINSNFFISQIEHIRDSDIVVGNGIFEFKNKNQLIFKNLRSLKKAMLISPYMYVRNLIISPGQCLIRKKSIPTRWVESKMQKNGADDYYLWLLLMSEGKKWSYNNSLVYIHHFTGENLSQSEEKMFLSLEEMLNLLEVDSQFNKKIFKNLRCTILYKHQIAKGKKYFIVESIKNPFVFLYNIYFRIIWRGCHL